MLFAKISRILFSKSTENGIISITKGFAENVHFANGMGKSACPLAAARRIHVTQLAAYSTAELGVENDQQERTPIQRLIPRSKEEELEAARRTHAVQPENSKSLKVSVIGTPNSGKSTLTNALMKWRVCSVSKKVHTTKRNTTAVLVEGNAQIVFLDTPGIISLKEKRKYHLHSNMMNDPGIGANTADLLLVIVDASNIWTRTKLDANVIAILENNLDKSSVLVLNKTDLVRSKKILLDLTRILSEGFVDGIYTHVDKSRTLQKAKSLERLIRETEIMLNQRQSNPYEDGSESLEMNKQRSEEELDASLSEKIGWSKFERVFMTSALTGEGVEDLREYLIRSAKPKNWTCNPNVVTDQSAHEIALLAVREKLMDHLPKEVPYVTNLVIEMWQVDSSGILRIAMTVDCATPNHKKLIIGHAGKIISKIADEARQELMNTFRCEVSLKLVVDCRKRK